MQSGRTALAAAVVAAASAVGLLAGCGSSSSTGAGAAGPSASSRAQHPPAGTPIAGENISAQYVATLQHIVDEGQKPWRLRQEALAREFVRERFGWVDLNIKVENPTTVVVTNNPDGSKVRLQMSQPAQKGAGGLWVVDNGVWM